MMSDLLVYSALYLFALWILTGGLLWAHKRSHRTGPAPLYVGLGSLLLALQLYAVGPLVSFAGETLRFTFGSYVLLPVLLTGVLLVYVADGTVQASFLIRSLIGGTLLLALYKGVQTYLGLFVLLPAIETEILSVNTPRDLLASSIALAVDFFMMTVVYQAVCNWRNKYPSAFAALMALLVALWVDALLYPLIAYAGQPGWWQHIPAHILGKTLFGAAVMVLLNPYLHRVVPEMSGSMATTPRPPLDIFTNAVQMEARAQHYYSLLRTILHINQLIASTTDKQNLLQQVCDALVELRNYHIVWIISVDESRSDPPCVAYAGVVDEKILERIRPDALLERHQEKAFDDAVILNSIYVKNSNGNFCDGEGMLEIGCQSAGLFPMRHQGKVFGLLGICAKRRNYFDDLESGLLQEMADGLAYEMHNLETRSQRVLLQKSTETMQDGLLILNMQGEIIYANRVVAVGAGFSQAELSGQNIQIFLSEQQQLALPRLYTTLLEKGVVVVDMEYQGANLPHPMMLSVTATLGKDLQGNPKHIVVNIRDVTAQRQHEQRLLALHQLATDLVQIHNLDSLMQTFLQTGEELLDADASAIYLADSQTQKIIQTVSHNLPDEYVSYIAASDLQGMPGEKVLRTLSPVYVNDTLHDATYGAKVYIVAKYGFRSLIILPVLYQEQFFGALTLYYRQPYSFSEADVQIGMTLAHTLAISYQNAKLYQQESQQRKLAEALARAAAAINQSLNLDDVLDQILEQLMRVVPCKTANIVLVESGRVVLTRQRGPNRFFLSQTVFDNVAELMGWQTYRTMYEEKSQVFIPDTWANEHWVKHKDTLNIRSYIGTPLVSGEQVVGFLNIDSDQPNGLKAEYLPQLRTFANYAAVAIENARLYAHVIQRSEENAALLATASVVSKSLDFMEVLRVVAAQMLGLFEADTCAILDYDSRRNRSSVLLVYSAEGEVEMPASSDCYILDAHLRVRDVLKTGAPQVFHITDPKVTDEVRRRLKQENIGTLVLLPLMLQDQPIGLIVLSDEQSNRSFSVREISLGLSMASHAAVAIENARLYRQLQEHAEDLEHRVRQRTRQLQEITEYVEGILESVPEAVFVLNQNGQLVRTNQIGETLYRQAQADGVDLFNLELLTHLEQDSPGEQPLVEVDGKTYQVVFSLLEGNSQHAGGKVVVFRDVTHFRELDQMKTRFVSDVSHELRTPLTNLTLYLDLLASTHDTQKQGAYIRTLQRETERLTYLIEDLLTISRLEAGRIHFQMQPTDINLLVNALVSDRVTLAEQKNIALEFFPGENLPYAQTDPNLLTRALSNLLTNAANYTQAGGSIRVSTSQPEPGWLVIRVADTGLGIPSEERERIFDRFYRGYASRVTGAEGTGLGLAISQEILQRMNGKITLESTVGKGSTFTIWLPVA